MSRKQQHPNCRIPRLRKRAGRCYELAFYGALRAQEWVIVHGACVGPYWTGRMGHAWLEHAGKVYDVVQDKVYEVDDYAAKFRAVEHARYTFWDASKRVAHTGHLGPWPAG